MIYMSSDYVYTAKFEGGQTVALTMNDMEKIAKQYRFLTVKHFIESYYPEGKDDLNELTNETIFQMNMFKSDMMVALEDAIYIIEQEKKEKEAR